MKLKQPVLIQAEYKITTPMFLGDAFQETDADQMRNASLKGALRFWWRALNWGRVLAAAKGDEIDALKRLHGEEGALFGRASDSKSSEQSLVQITSQLKDCQRVEAGAQPQNLTYLLGQGLYSHNTKGPAGKKGTQRPYLKDGRLLIEVRLKPSAKEEQALSTRQALVALGLFGGLGSRARKGLGSLSLQWVDYSNQREEFPDLDAIETFLQRLNFDAPDGAPLTALSRGSRIEAVPSNRTALQLLADVGQELQSYRDGTVPGRDRRNNFRHDREIALKAAKGERVDTLPSRAIFGLPHNYFWIESKDKLEIAPKESTRNRRASPLMIHIHEFPDGHCAAIQLLFPSRFLPDQTVLELKGKRTSNLTDPKVSYQPIINYLDGFPQRKVLRNGQ